MRRSLVLSLAPALLVALLAAVPTPAQPEGLGGRRAVLTTAAQAEPEMSDAEALEKAGLSPTDGVKLIAYLKQRTLSDTDQGKIQAIIRRFGADEFEERQRASEEVELFGPAAISPLRAAERDPDPEVAFRASRALKRLEKVPHAAVAAAAVRAVVRLKPPDAPAALLGFLPLADTEAVADEIREALAALAVRDGKPDSTILAALNDPSPVRRAAAYVALVEGGPPNERGQLREALPRVKEAVRKEPDPDAKFAGLWSLVLTTREKELVPDLIGTVPNLPRGRVWQLEDFLHQLAGASAPKASFGKTPETLAKARDAWLGWWTQRAGGINLTKFDFKPRVRGFTDLVELDQRGYNQGRVVCLGPNLKEKWRLVGVNNPSDARVQPDGLILLVEQNYNRITLREPAGKIVKQWTPNQPVAAELLPGGGLLAVGRNQIVEFDKDGRQVHQFIRLGPNNAGLFDVMNGCRLPNGDVVFVTSTFQGANCFRLDAKLKDTGKSYTLGRVQHMQGLEAIGDERILVCETDKVAEYDLKTGKAVWSYRLPSAPGAMTVPTSAQRLPSGNTLIASLNQNLVVEVDPDGEVVWEYQPKDGLRVCKAYRR